MMSTYSHNPPPASAPYEERASWCDAYVGWFISQVPAEDPQPKDARPTHRWETEFEYGVVDPEEYFHQTQYELDLAQEDEDAREERMH